MAEKSERKGAKKVKEGEEEGKVLGGRGSLRRVPGFWFYLVLRCLWVRRS